MNIADDRDAVARQLREAKVPRSYAWQIAWGRRSPSLALAKKIEAATGIPPSTWPLPEAERQTG